ncbi:MAG: hypothetical protein NT027_06770 [Proteobacteria bacterium]|nr:hypothetical protein [Pseudomonadota bacterium]
MQNSKDDIVEGILRHSPQVIYKALSPEVPSIIASILGSFPAARSAAILKLFKNEERAEILMKLSLMNSVHESSLETALRSLLETIESQKLSENSQVGGVEYTAQLISNLGPAQREIVLEDLKLRNPELSQILSERLFTFASLGRFSSQEMQKIIQKIPEKDLLLALRICSEEFKEKVFCAMSERRAENTKDLLRTAPQARKSDVEQAQSQIAKLVLGMIKSGEILDPDEVKI